MVPPEGFAVTDDPLGAEMDDDPLEVFPEESPLDLRWSPAGPADEQDTDLPHWTDPPTGQVPAVLARDEPDLPEWQRAGDTGPVWREHEHDWADPGFEPSMLADEETRVGELRTDDTSEERRPWEFGESAEGSEDIWPADEEEVSEEELIVELDSGPSGQVTTISSSVRRVTSGQVQAPPTRLRHGRRKPALSTEPVPEQSAPVHAGAAQAGRTPHPFDPPSDGGSGRNMTLAITTGVAVRGAGGARLVGRPAPHGDPVDGRRNPLRGGGVRDASALGSATCDIARPSRHCSSGGRLLRQGPVCDPTYDGPAARRHDALVPDRCRAGVGCRRYVLDGLRFRLGGGTRGFRRRCSSPRRSSPIATVWRSSRVRSSRQCWTTSVPWWSVDGSGVTRSRQM